MQINFDYPVKFNFNIDGTAQRVHLGVFLSRFFKKYLLRVCFCFFIFNPIGTVRIRVNTSILKERESLSGLLCCKQNFILGTSTCITKFLFVSKR